MAKITYLLGAGASCHCLPTYANFKARFARFQLSLEENISNMNSEEDRKSVNEIISLARIINEEFSFHSTPDTIAKKYFHLRENGSQKLNDLKILLTLFFMFEQCLSKEAIVGLNLTDEKIQVDRRYDAFIAAVLEPTYSKIKVDPNFNILTWNYDLQFELCFQNYFNKEFVDTQYEIQSIPSEKTLEKNFKFDINKFSIVHLNGIAYSPAPNENTLFGSFCNSSQLIQYLVSYFTSMKEGSTNNSPHFLNFAWERDKSFEQPKEILNIISNCASQIVETTEVLVIIGYSFPIFNRELDTALFRNMKELKYVYIQSPDAVNLKETIIDVFHPVRNSINEKNVFVVKSLDYFFIPAEWNRKIPDDYSFF